MGHAAFTPEQQSWQFYDDDGAEPTNAKAGEDTMPTLSSTTEKCRLRICIIETGGDSGSNNIAIDLEYSLNDADWVAFGAANHWDYADGEATEGNIVTGLKIGDSDTQGEYSESAGGSGTFDFGAGTATEFDICILQTGNATSATKYYFRVKIDTAEVVLNGAHVHANLTTASGTAWEKELSDTFNLSDSLIKGVGLNKAEAAFGIADSISKEPGLIKSEAAFGIADSISKEPGKLPSDNIAITDSFARQVDYQRAFSETETIGDNISKEPGLIKGDNLSISDSLVVERGLVKLLADTLSIADSLTKEPGLGKAETFSISDSQVKTIGLFKADTFNISDAIAKTITIITSDIFNLADSLSKEPGIIQADNLSISDSQVKDIGLFKSDNLSLSDNLAKTMSLIKADSFAMADALSKGFGLFESDSLTINDSIVKEIGIILDDLLSILDSPNVVLTPGAGAALSIILHDIMSISDSFDRQVDYQRSFSDNLTITDTISRVWNAYLELYDAMTIADSWHMQWGLPPRWAIRMGISRFLEGRFPPRRFR